jgi:hypothetical protein
LQLERQNRLFECIPLRMVARLEAQRRDAAMARLLTLTGVAIALVSSAAFAQDRTVVGAETAGVSSSLTGEELKSYCVFNNKIFSQGVDICVRKGIAYKCNGPSADGKVPIASWSAVSSTCLSGSELPPP